MEGGKRGLLGGSCVKKVGDSPGRKKTYRTKKEEQHKELKKKLDYSFRRKN